MPSAKTIVSTAASVAASAMVIRSIARELVPHELKLFVLMNIRGLFESFSSEITLIIDQFDGLASNQIYRAADIYLGNKISPSTKMFRVSMPEKENKMSISMAKNQEIVDHFDGVKLKWKQVTRQVESTQYVSYTGQSTKMQSEIRYFNLTFHKQHKDKVLNSYFPYILRKSKSAQEENKTLKLYSLNQDHARRFGLDSWHWITFNHPATFDTLAMEAELKKMIIEDLERFVKRKDYYRRVGKAWKRGYLLYGPPGTGKSSLIAAMSNYLNFDIYDLELSAVHSNSELRRVLLSTGNRSILVVEDIDCSLELEDRQAQPTTVNVLKPLRTMQVTLSGLLNFLDGLWSSCGDERIIVFTTNHKDRLDPAVLRPGRMDVHIYMSYCTPCGFDSLAANYLGITDHPLIYEIKEIMQNVRVTPADVGEQLLKNEDPEIALKGLLEFLNAKLIEGCESQAS
ncbi:protein HYPER-SENSITIVITY-RELATED 4 [Citrus sinensis]|uniref:Protein HYPER-SENSITIVITY-RELATED 4 n=1 Tax=Citrus sinensis TaxID=2711 RepID=A0ACB8IH05_CITSI|nr:protein HYPER-SENSITIVITY-RELATED 4 [Citrus sinensis]